MKSWRNVFLMIAFVLAVGLFVRINTVQGSNDKNNPPKLDNSQLLPILLPPDVVTYETVSNDSISSTDKRIIAKLTQSPKQFDDKTDVFIPTIVPLDNPDQIAYTFNSAIRYSGEKGSVYVTTVKPSFTMDKVIVIEETIVRNNKKGLFIKSVDDKSNQLSFMQDDLLVSVVGPLSQGEMKQLVEDIVFVGGE